MFAVRETSSDLSVLPIPEICTWNISLESTLLDLPLYNCQIELTQKAEEVALAFEENSLLPGVILTDCVILSAYYPGVYFLKKLTAATA